MLGCKATARGYHIDSIENEGFNMRPATLDPKKHLVGATPEKLARALLRPRHRTQSVVSDKVPSEEVSTDKSKDGVAHLVKSS